MKTYALIPAGGKGLRLGSEIPKQYLKIKGKEIIAYTLEVFQLSNLIDEIIIAAEENFFPLLEEIKTKYGLAKITRIVKGGTTRQDSVLNALNSIAKPKYDDLIVVHDAARPLLDLETLNKAIAFAKEKGNAVTAVKINDTLFEGSKTVERFLDREKIYSVQTPQIFPYSQLKEAMEKAYAENFQGTDESSLVFRTSNKVNIFTGKSNNLKITSENDLALFEFFLNLNFK